MEFQGKIEKTACLFDPLSILRLKSVTGYWLLGNWLLVRHQFPSNQ